MGSETETQSVSTTISDLEPGTDYVAQVYVENKSDAKAWIKVTFKAPVRLNIIDFFIYDTNIVKICDILACLTF